MTYELNRMSIWQHPTNGNHLEITKTVWEKLKDRLQKQLEVYD